MNLFKYICSPRSGIDSVDEEITKGGHGVAVRRIQNAVRTLYQHPDGRAIEMTPRDRLIRGMVRDELWRPLHEMDIRHQASGYIDTPDFYGIGCNMEALIRDAFALVEETVELEEAEDRARWVGRLRAVEEHRAERVRRAAKEQAIVDAATLAWEEEQAAGEQACIEASAEAERLRRAAN
jgi:hypothetical protein